MRLNTIENSAVRPARILPRKKIVMVRMRVIRVIIVWRNAVDARDESYSLFARFALMRVIGVIGVMCIIFDAGDARDARDTCESCFARFARFLSNALMRVWR